MQGVKPAALSMIKDPEVKGFIEKCLVPAAQRLSAKDLLSDPFLKVDKLSEIEKNHLLHVPEIGIAKVGISREKPLQKEEPKSSKLLIKPLECITGLNLSVTTVNSSDDGITLEVLKKKNDNEFSLSGKRQDANSVSLVLRMEDEDGKYRFYDHIFFAIFLIILWEQS